MLLYIFHQICVLISLNTFTVPPIFLFTGTLTAYVRLFGVVHSLEASVILLSLLSRCWLYELQCLPSCSVVLSPVIFIGLFKPSRVCLVGYYIVQFNNWLMGPFKSSIILHFNLLQGNWSSFKQFHGARLPSLKNFRKFQLLIHSHTGLADFLFSFRLCFPFLCSMHGFSISWIFQILSQETVILFKFAWTLFRASFWLVSIIWSSNDNLILLSEPFQCYSGQSHSPGVMEASDTWAAGVSRCEVKEILDLGCFLPLGVLSVQAGGSWTNGTSDAIGTLPEASATLGVGDGPPPGLYILTLGLIGPLLPKAKGSIWVPAWSPADAGTEGAASALGSSNSGFLHCVSTGWPLPQPLAREGSLSLALLVFLSMSVVVQVAGFSCAHFRVKITPRSVVPHLQASAGVLSPIFESPCMISVDLFPRNFILSRGEGRDNVSLCHLV